MVRKRYKQHYSFLFKNLIIFECANLQFFFNKQTVSLLFFSLFRKAFFIFDYSGNYYICGLIKYNFMDVKVSPAKSGTPYGLLFGVIMILEFVIMYVIGMKSLVNTSVGTIVNIANYLVLPLLFIYLGCTNYKKNINNGFISFSESLKTGVSITIIAGLTYAFFSVIFNFIFPDFINEMLDITKEQMIKQNPNITSKELEMGLGMVKKFMNPFIVFPVTLVMYALIGLIYSLIIGGIVKNEKP